MPEVPTAGELVGTIWDTETASYVRIFKCRCGELVWEPPQRV